MCVRCFKVKLYLFAFLFLLSSALSDGSLLAQGGGNKDKNKITQKDRQDAAARAKKEGLTAAAITTAATTAALPGEAPRYFSHPNYANSPLPTISGAVIPVGNQLIDRAYAGDFPVAVGELAPVFVVIPAVLPDGSLQSFQTWNQATPGGSAPSHAGA